MVIRLPISITIPEWYFWETADVIVKLKDRKTVAIKTKDRELIAEGDHYYVLQKALEHRGRIYVKGDFVIGSETLKVYSDTELIINGSITKTENGGIYNAILSIVGGNVKIRGGKLIDKSPTTSTTYHIINFLSATNPISDVVIEDVVLENAAGKAIYIGNEYGIDNVKIINVKVNVTRGDSGIGIGKRAKRVVIEDTDIIEPYHTGINVWGCESYVIIRGTYIKKQINTLGKGIAVTAIRDTVTEKGNTIDIIIEDNKIIGAIEYDGISVTGDAEKVVIKNNIVDGASRNGIMITYMTFDTTRYFGKKTIIEGNLIRNVGESGVWVNGPGRDVDDPAYDVVVAKNLIENTLGWGIVVDGRDGVKILDNILMYVNRDTSKTTADGYTTAIYLSYCKRVLVRGNTIIDDGTIDCGIADRVTNFYSDENIFVENIIRGVKGPVIFKNANTIVRGNKGYVSENSGVATLPAGATSVTVTHGLAATPSKVLITPLGQPAGKLWVANITSTSFDIVTDTAPTVDLQIAWYAEI